MFSRPIQRYACRYIRCLVPSITLSFHANCSKSRMVGSRFAPQVWTSWVFLFSSLRHLRCLYSGTIWDTLYALHLLSFFFVSFRKRQNVNKVTRLFTSWWRSYEICPAPAIYGRRELGRIFNCKKSSLSQSNISLFIFCFYLLQFLLLLLFFFFLSFFFFFFCTVNANICYALFITSTPNTLLKPQPQSPAAHNLQYD